MKRILYVSHFSHDWKSHEIQNLADKAAQNNRELSITGMLLTFERLFFQIIEGPEAGIASLFNKICQDPRHCEIAIIQTEANVQNRLFKDWHMRAFDLDRNPDALEYSVKVLLRSLLGNFELIGMYNHPGILEKIKAGINPAAIAPARIKKIVMFADIVGFSKLSEEIPVESVFKIVTSFFEIVTEAVKKHGGAVEKFIGDCVMASFSENSARNAIGAGLDILLNTSKILVPVTAGNSPETLACGIGCAIGSLIQGNVGSGDRLDYTILGDTVNTAQRLEQFTRILPFSLAMTSELKHAVADFFPCISLGVHDLKGKQTSVEIFSVDCPVARKQPAK